MTGLEEKASRKIYTNPPASFLIQKAVRTTNARLSSKGALVVETGAHTGRSASDKYIVKTPTTENSIWWENTLTPMDTKNFETLRADVTAYLNEDRDLYVTERSVGAHQEHNIEVRTITTHPSHALFTQHLFRSPKGELSNNCFTILHAPEMKLDPSKYGIKNPTVITTCFEKNITIIVGSLYAGEIKKSMFCVMNYLLPEKGVLPMHTGCSENTKEEVSLFFGLSGTGKTTLSTDEGMLLIGDDEHGLSDEGVFNFEGGCYAKTYKLSRETEPEIYDACNRFGALLENVTINEKTGQVDFFDKSITENGRASYPLDFIADRKKIAQGGLPKNIFFLTADAFGVLPPIAKLNKEQAMFYFVLGYTAKVAGTEVGIKEPEATFSPCFGAPFMMRQPEVYAKLLGEYLDRHNINVWLINTGWTGGPYGVGHRFPLPTTRAIIRCVQNNLLEDVPTERDPIFGLEIPVKICDVSATLLFPQQSWTDSEAYTQQAKSLASQFHREMARHEQFYKLHKAGGPAYSDSL
jgi:phosphoenolpyruvate carboxykinase (ATP)